MCIHYFIKQINDLYDEEKKNRRKKAFGTRSKHKQCFDLASERWRPTFFLFLFSLLSSFYKSDMNNVSRHAKVSYIIYNLNLHYNADLFNRLKCNFSSSRFLTEWAFISASGVS